MIKKTNQIAYLILLFFILNLQIITAQTQCSSVKLLQENADFCDGLTVTLSGKVTNLDLLTSKSGNDYTIFILDDYNLKDDTDQIKVFSYSHLQISEGDIISLNGTFYKSRTHKGYTFYFEIVTTPKNISIIEKSISFPNHFIVLLLIGCILIGFVTYKKYKPNKHKIGRTFESYTISLFDARDWIISTKTGDFAEKLGRKVESDSNPDLIMKHRDTNKIIAIECKYRSAFKELKKGQGLNWAQEYQMKNYKVYQEKTHSPVFVVIAVGGKPTNPQHLYLLPLYSLKYSLVFKEYLDRFERDPKTKFTLKEFKKFYNKLR